MTEVSVTNMNSLSIPQMVDEKICRYVFLQKISDLNKEYKNDFCVSGHPFLRLIVKHPELHIPDNIYTNIVWPSYNWRKMHAPATKNLLDAEEYWHFQLSQITHIPGYWFDIPYIKRYSSKEKMHFAGKYLYITDLPEKYFFTSGFYGMNGYNNKGTLFEDSDSDSDSDIE